MRGMIVAGTALCVALAACTGKKQAPTAISRTKFVQANADLRSVPDTVPNGDRLREAALKKHRVSEADLRRFVTVHQRNTEYMATVWREIADSVQKRYDRSFPLQHPTTEHPHVPNQPPGATPVPAGEPVPATPAGPPPTVNTPAGQPRQPQRPHPPKLPVTPPRLVRPSTAPLDTLDE
ncbi:hypothetical protein [Longimicrobium sp.]|uniref:hypothetical protein n=1 Tax=Longimicrobium sp. TaxID=2029185 RepID=UPI002C93FFF5|nr:hypothetical protein [Longimicrobium sp.]HSU13751.1 hypothetical protein [Longimicrobium sp.]